jgi:uncharacterized Zn finger protein
MREGKNPRVQYRCSFCSRSQEQVHRLIAGPGGVYICNECINLCNEIIGEEVAHPAPLSLGVTPQQQLRSRILTAVHDVRTHITAGDYGTAATAAEALLDNVRQLQELGSE